MPSQKRRIAVRVAYSLLMLASVRSSVPISARMSASILSVNLPVASSFVMPALSSAMVAVIDAS